MKELRFLLLGLVICLASGVKAQIYSSDVLFYVSESAKLTNPQTTVHIFLFKDGKFYEANGISDIRKVCDNLRDNDFYFERLAFKWERKGVPYWATYDFIKYNEELSNSKWRVYSAWFAEEPGLWKSHTRYEAFASDLSKYMRWEEPDWDDAGRKTCRRINKNELKQLTFTSGRDFLQ